MNKLKVKTFKGNDETYNFELFAGSLFFRIVLRSKAPQYKKVYISLYDFATSRSIFKCGLTPCYYAEMEKLFPDLSGQYISKSGMDIVVKRNSYDSYSILFVGVMKTNTNATHSYVRMFLDLCQ
jgi:hypothetical protein